VPQAEYHMDTDAARSPEFGARCDYGTAVACVLVQKCFVAVLSIFMSDWRGFFLALPPLIIGNTRLFGP